LITDYLKEGSLLSFLAKDPEKDHKAFLSLEHFLKIPPFSEANEKFWMYLETKEVPPIKRAPRFYKTGITHLRKRLLSNM
jgi:hypothetical protein